MNWFEKIKSMDKKQLAEFLANFDMANISDNYCNNVCADKIANGLCKYDFECSADDACIIEKWLDTET